MATIDDLHELALLWLEASLDALAAVPTGPPDRAYVAPGQPAIDCEQLVVWAQLIGEAAFAAGAGAEARAKAINRGGLAKVTIQIQVVRCLPAGQTGVRTFTPPTAAELELAAQMIDEDGWALWLGLNRHLKHDDGILFAACSGAERLGMDKLVPQGGYGGWNAAYRVPLEGGVLGT